MNKGWKIVIRVWQIIESHVSTPLPCNHCAHSSFHIPKWCPKKELKILFSVFHQVFSVGSHYYYFFLFVWKMTFHRNRSPFIFYVRLQAYWTLSSVALLLQPKYSKTLNGRRNALIFFIYSAPWRMAEHWMRAQSAHFKMILRYLINANSLNMQFNAHFPFRKWWILGIR